MNLSFRFAGRIRPFVRYELDAAERHDALQESAAAFRRLERAHVLGQASTVEHVRVHAAMLRWAVCHRQPAEALGQAWRLAGALLKTWLWVPTGNTGGAGVSGFARMPIPAELQRLIDAARRWLRGAGRPVQLPRPPQRRAGRGLPGAALHRRRRPRHAGQMATLEAVVVHGVRSPAAAAGHSGRAHGGRDHAERPRLRLTDEEARELVAFLKTLSELPR